MPRSSNPPNPGSPEPPQFKHPVYGNLQERLQSNLAALDYFLPMILFKSDLPEGRGKRLMRFFVAISDEAHRDNLELGKSLGLQEFLWKSVYDDKAVPVGNGDRDEFSHPVYATRAERMGSNLAALYYFISIILDPDLPSPKARLFMQFFDTITYELQEDTSQCWEPLEEDLDFIYEE